MRIEIQLNNAQVSEEAVETIKSKIKNLEKYCESIHDAIIYLKEENEKKTIELKLHLKDNQIFISEKQQTFSHALDNVMDIAKKQLKKYKEIHQIF